MKSFSVMNIPKRSFMIRKFGVEYHLVDSCNLRCAGCSHYSSLLDQLSYVPLETVKKEMELLFYRTENGQQLRWLRLLGGEPLLHPQVTQCLKYIRSIFPNTRITLVTNGIKLDKMEESFYKACCECEIAVLVTDYYIIDINKTFNFLKEKNVKVELYRTCKTWNYQNIRMTQEKFDCFTNCYHKIMCPNYRNECLFLCPQMAYLDIFNSTFKTKIPINRNEFLNLNEIDNFEELIRKFDALHPDFCSIYCNCKGNDGNPILEGERRRTQKDINEFCLCN